jgi:hypothetical protein
MPSRYALLELFGHVALGPCWVTETERYGKKFCEARKLKPDGTMELPMLLGPGAIFRETEITREEALDRARPDWSPLPRVALPPYDEDDLCTRHGTPYESCGCAEDGSDTEPSGPITLPVPLAEIESLVFHCRAEHKGSELNMSADIVQAWCDQERSDIPF